MDKRVRSGFGTMDPLKDGQRISPHLKDIYRGLTGSVPSTLTTTVYVNSINSTSLARLVNGSYNVL